MKKRIIIDAVYVDSTQDIKLFLDKITDLLDKYNPECERFTVAIFSELVEKINIPHKGKRR